MSTSAMQNFTGKSKRIKDKDFSERKLKLKNVKIFTGRKNFYRRHVNKASCTNLFIKRLPHCYTKSQLNMV